MTGVLVLITALVFFYIGKYSRTTKEKDIIRSLRKNKPVQSVKPKTREDMRKEKSGEKEVEDLMSSEFRKPYEDI